LAQGRARIHQASAKSGHGVWLSIKIFVMQWNPYCTNLAFQAEAWRNLETWPTPTDFYQTLVAPRPSAPSKNEIPQRRSVDNGMIAPWVYDTVLVVDVDGTLIRPVEDSRRRPTPFPLPDVGQIRIESQLGRCYAIRNGLDTLGRILSYPWRGKILLSRSRQAKVNEVASQIRIGSKSLDEIVDACVGAEALCAFAARQGLRLPFNADVCLSNPRGRPAKSKPGELPLLTDLRPLGAALREGNMAEAMVIVQDSPLRPAFTLAVDDQPYYEPQYQTQAFYRVLPYTRIENFKDLFAGIRLAPPFQFNFLDYLWRLNASPFGYLDFLLAQSLTWTEFVERLGLEFDVANALRGHYPWKALCRRHGSGLQTYLDFVAVRRPDEDTLLAARYTEHARVYHALRDYIARDVKRGWQVLLLGRDMDYMFQTIRASDPKLVRGTKVVSVPLSRPALREMPPELLVRFLNKTLKLSSGSGRRLMIYDVGYHGTIPAFIKCALKQSRRSRIRKVEVRLLNVCGCKVPESERPGKAVTFSDSEGRYLVSREFGISIERCPHTTGCLEKILQTGRRFQFQFVAHDDAEQQEALALMKRIRLKKPSIRAHPKRLNFPLRRLARRALDRIRVDNPRYDSSVRHQYQRFYDLGRSPQMRQIETAVYPWSGFDLLTPLLCFPKLRRLIMVDRFPVGVYRRECRPDVAAAAETYLTQVAGDFCRDQSPQSIPEAKHETSVTRAILPEVHSLAMLSSPVLLSMASLLPRVEINLIRTRSLKRRLSLLWRISLDSRKIAVEYHCDEIPFADGRRAKYEGILAGSQSTLILRGGDVFRPGNSADISPLVSAAKVVLYDDLLDCHGESNTNDTLAGVRFGECVEVIPSAANAEKEAGRCRVFLNQTKNRKTSPTEAAESLLRTPTKSIHFPLASVQEAVPNN
jgi:hypothetical protein